MTRFVLFLTFSLFFGGLIFLIPYHNAYAQQTTNQPCGTTTFDCYQESGFRLINNPVICMGTPSDPTLATKLQGYTMSAVEEWITQLNLGSTSRNPLWNIQVIPTATSNACNISISYITKPTPNEQGTFTDPVGVTTVYTDHTASIQIFYDDVQVDANGVLEYVDSPAPDYQMQWAIRHELGHVFGLGHYMMSNQEIDQWLSYGYTAPSIMVPIIADPRIDGNAGIFTSAIEPNDITQLKSLYNNNGFGGQSSQPSNPRTPPKFIPEVPALSIPTTNKELTIQISASLKYEVKDWVSGEVGNRAFVDFLGYLDYENAIVLPPARGEAYSQIVIPSWIKNDAKWWLQGEITDGDLIKSLEYMINNGIIQLQ